MKLRHVSLRNVMFVISLIEEGSRENRRLAGQFIDSLSLPQQAELTAIMIIGRRDGSDRAEDLYDLTEELLPELGETSGYLLEKIELAQFLRNGLFDLGVNEATSSVA